MSILQSITKQFISETKLNPVVSTELEFYIDPKGKEVSDGFVEDLNKELLACKIPFIKFERERGENQFEISLIHADNPALIANITNTVKKIISKQAEKFVMEAVFEPKPYENQPGSGMHIHISLLDKEGINVFSKEGDEEETEHMKYAIGGLLETMAESMVFFAPYENSYKRFTAKYNKDSETYNNAPTNISWGANNRTTAIRIPSSSKFPETRHIEHRSPGSDANSEMAISAILIGIKHGLENKISPNEKIFGNAYDKQYANLKKLPASLTEAIEAFNSGKITSNHLKYK